MDGRATYRAPHEAGPAQAEWGEAGLRWGDDEVHHARREREPSEAGPRERGLREQGLRGDRRDRHEPHGAAAESELGPKDLQHEEGASRAAREGEDQSGEPQRWAGGEEQLPQERQQL